jgi:hypothetical protein
MKKSTYENRLRAFENEKKKLYEQNLTGKRIIELLDGGSND